MPWYVHQFLLSAKTEGILSAGRLTYKFQAIAVEIDAYKVEICSYYFISFLFLFYYVLKVYEQDNHSIYTVREL